MDQDEGGLGDEEARDEPEPAPSQAPEPKSTNLKDLFAPRNEEAGFSLLGHLDIDLELDDEIPFAIEEPSITQPLSTAVPAFQPSIPTTTTTTSHTITYLNPKQPLFFPLPHHTSTDSSASDSFTIKARQRDIFDVIKDNRWDWCDPGVKFYKTSTEEEIRKDWEEKKGDLTRDWKKRAREAGKASRKRKGGVDGDADV
ncbi:hypothetical protein CC2G_012224 [Coprinopsis cinerea AmutBmut pab1-1]|nr:hypothetical protein CC2G_012224 [Coprinopsis cinerea AmutBmut pab1-1]